MSAAPAPMATFDPLARAARATPEAPALCEDGRWLSYAELSRAVQEWAALFARAGAHPGRRIALVVRPDAAGVRALHAAFRTGATVVPLNPALTAAELAPALGLLRPSVVVAEEERTVRLKEALRDVEGSLLLALTGSGPRAVEPPRGAIPARCALPGVAIVWTSGTSGRPRGILLTAEGLEANARAASERLGLGPEDRWLATLSPAHVGGLALVTRAALLGSGLVPFARFDAAEVLASARRDGVTHASLVPTHLHRILDALGEERAPPSLAALLLGGAAAPPPLVRAATLRELPVAITYGLTEATSQVATATPEESQGDPSTPGRPLAGIEVAVDAEGGIRVRGATVAAGRIVAEGEDGRLRVDPLTDADGWLDTGDLGHLDERGRLRLTGRRSDRIVSGGVTVDPMEVEGVLLAHPSVIEATVVGVPDEVWGERVVAVVTMRAAGPFPGADSLSAYLRDRLTGAKRPKELRALETLPRNPNGKVDREAVRGLFARDGG